MFSAERNPADPPYLSRLFGLSQIDIVSSCGQMSPQSKRKPGLTKLLRPNQNVEELQRVSRPPPLVPLAPHLPSVYLVLGV